MKPHLLLFGTPNYSLIVFEKLFAAGYPIAGVVSKPPRPVGRLQDLITTPVANWAVKKQIPLLTLAANPTKPWLFADKNTLVQKVMNLNPDLLITADYTQKIPSELYSKTKFGGLNVHPSLLPAYRGPAPVPWAILNGEKVTGVSIVTLSEQFDAGIIVAQEKEPIKPADTTDTLLTRLFVKGADLLIKTLRNNLSQLTTLNSSVFAKASADKQPTTNNLQPSYFPRLTRDSGFEPWEKIKIAINTGVGAERIERKWRALHPWPGLWTKVRIKDHEKRFKILKLNLQLTTYLPRRQAGNLQLTEIQLEGKQPIATNISDWLTDLTA
ncbi:MAG: methionyl-tRNA formyltransferase [Patescibacteria group bacterium]